MTDGVLLRLESSFENRVSWVPCMNKTGLQHEESLVSSRSRKQVILCSDVPDGCSPFHVEYTGVKVVILTSVGL